MAESNKDIYRRRVNELVKAIYGFEGDIDFEKVDKGVSHLRNGKPVS